MSMSETPRTPQEILADAANCRKVIAEYKAAHRYTDWVPVDPELEAMAQRVIAYEETVAKLIQGLKNMQAERDKLAMRLIGEEATSKQLAKWHYKAMAERDKLAVTAKEQYDRAQSLQLSLLDEMEKRDKLAAENARLETELDECQTVNRQFTKVKVADVAEIHKLAAQVEAQAQTIARLEIETQEDGESIMAVSDKNDELRKALASGVHDLASFFRGLENHSSGFANAIWPSTWPAIQHAALLAWIDEARKLLARKEQAG